MEILKPIDQLGWARAVPGVTLAICSRVQVERTAGGGEDDTLHRMLLVVLQRLEDGAVFAVDRNQPAAAFGNGAHEKIAGGNEAFLVGKGNIGATLRGGQRRREPGRADDCRHHPFRRHGGGFDQGILARAGGDARPGQGILQILIALLVGSDRQSCAAGPSLLGQQLDIVAPGDRGDVEGITSPSWAMTSIVFWPMEPVEPNIVRRRRALLPVFIQVPAFADAFLKALQGIVWSGKSAACATLRRAFAPKTKALI